MKEISITVSGLSTLCRLCLSSGVELLDIFQFSSKMRENVASVIMKHAAVQITRIDEMPNFLCQSCFTQLEKTHQFLLQIEQSDRTLRRYLQKLYASDKLTKADWFGQPEDIILNTDKDAPDMDLNCKNTKPENSNQKNKNQKEMCLKTEIGPVDDYLFLPTECAPDTEDNSSNIDGKEFSYENSKTKVTEDTAVNWKEKEPENSILTNNLMDKISLKFEISDENMDDNLLIPTESVDDPENASSNSDRNEISCEDMKINIGHASENPCFIFVNVTENFSKCDETNKNISVNRKKYKKANKLKSYQCNVCNMCFCDQSGLYYHKLTHTGEKPYKCNVCIKRFITSGELKTHQRTHTGEKPYQCNICKKCFSQSSHLKTHNFKHTGEKPFQCDLCEKRFYQSCDLNRHKLIHTGEKPYECNLCKKRFSLSYDLNRHKHIHTGEKPYQCDLCNKCFTTSSYLNLHKRMHTGEKPYHCDICNKRFSQSCHLSRHKRTHTDGKLYHCDLPNNCFSQSINLNTHKRIHTSEKTYQCDLCKKCFSQSSDLNRHKRVHTGEKPYQCDLCKKCFSQSSDLNRHKLIHTR